MRFVYDIYIQRLTHLGEIEWQRIVSPGVFTREKDLSFLPQGISEIGAALIGRTEEGPAFVPTQVRNFAEFEEIFGKAKTRIFMFLLQQRNTYEVQER